MKLTVPVPSIDRKAIVDCYSNPLGWVKDTTPSTTAIRDAAFENTTTVSLTLRNIRKATKVITDLITSRKFSQEVIVRRCDKAIQEASTGSNSIY